MLKKIQDYYCRDDINIDRQKNIDYAKFIAIIGMILIHVMMYPYYDGFDKPVGYFIAYISGGLLAAPVFMTSMGVGLAYTKQSSTNQIIVRGCKLVAWNYILNVLRSIYPAIAILPYGGDVLNRLIFYIFNGDILLFAGIAMILFGLLKKIKKNSDLYILLIGIALSIVSTLFRIVENDNALLAYTLGTFIPVNYYEEPVTYFQLCSWFIFVGVGNLLGITIRKCKNLNRFYTFLGLSGAIMSSVLLILDYKLGWQQYTLTIVETDSEYLAGIGYAGIAVGVVFAQFSLLYFITKITPKSLNEIVFKISNALNEIYIVSWTIILNISYAVLLPLLGDAPSIMWPYFLIFAAVLPLSVGLGLYWKKLKMAHNN